MFQSFLEKQACKGTLTNLCTKGYYYFMQPPLGVFKARSIPLVHQL